MSFKPEEHFRNLKGAQYLEVKWRVVWFREEHVDGYIRSELVEHDSTAGLAVFRAQAGWWTTDGREVYAADYGSETRKDFADYLEKSSTKAIGRALALLGYGTAQATELDEGDSVADSPVEPATKRTASANGQRATSKRTTTVHEPDRGAVQARLQALLDADRDAAVAFDAKLLENGKGMSDLSAEYMQRQIARLEAKARTKPATTGHPALDRVVDTAASFMATPAYTHMQEVVQQTETWLAVIATRTDGHLMATDMMEAKAILGQQYGILGREQCNRAEGAAAMRAEVERRHALVSARLAQYDADDEDEDEAMEEQDA